MRHSPRPREAGEISEAIHHQLSLYAVAATAAGVGLLALVQPAEGKIIYRYANKVIGPQTFLDLNHDGIQDFKFVYTNKTIGGMRPQECSGGTSGNLQVYGVIPSNQIQGQSDWASALPGGSYVGRAAKFQGTGMANVLAACEHNIRANGWWGGAFGRGVQRRYLGLTFAINGQIHYGWARLNVIISEGAAIQATITGYAYETIPGKAIMAGKKKDAAEERGVDGSSADTFFTSPIPRDRSASLGALALGAPAITLWRRKELGQER